MHKLKNTMYVHYHDRTATQRFLIISMLPKRSNLDYSHYMTNYRKYSIKIVTESKEDVPT